jgi:mono/diheme cytochrome c family protein
MNRALLHFSILATFPVAVACSSSSSGNGSSAQGDAASPGADASQTEDSSTGSGDSSIATANDSGTGGGEDSSPGNDSGGGDNDAAAVAFGANVYGSIIAVKCLGCHGPTADGGPGTGIQFGHLDMSTQATAYGNLVGDGGGVPADGVACAALGTDGLLRVAPGNPTTSLIYNKLASNDGDGGSILLADGGPMVFCGNPMPLHHPAISAADLGTIHDWIGQGATP